MTTADEMRMEPITKPEKIETSLTREALYSLVWSEPMLKVAARYGVSSSYLARVCGLLNVPRPERGYWAKLAFGKAPLVPALPAARPGDELVWSRNGHNASVQRSLPRPPETARKRIANSTASRVAQHPLIVGVKPLLEAGRLSYDVGYVKPAKKLLPDLAVTKTGLTKALSFANELFLSLESNGHRVTLAPYGEQFCRAEVDEREKPQRNRGYNNLWSPARCTVVYIGTVAIGLTVIEMSEEVEVRYVNGEYVRETDYTPPKRVRYGMDNTWTSKKNLATGRLCLQAYSPYPRAKWSQLWREVKERDLSTSIPTIIEGLEAAVIDVARLVEEGERQAQIEHERWQAQQEQWRKEEAERRAAKAQKDSKAELLGIVNTWAETRRIDQFFADAERRAGELSSDQKSAMLMRLKLARELIGTSNPLDRFKGWKAADER